MLVLETQGPVQEHTKFMILFNRFFGWVLETSVRFKQFVKTDYQGQLLKQGYSRLRLFPHRALRLHQQPTVNGSKQTLLTMLCNNHSHPILSEVDNHFPKRQSFLDFSGERDLELLCDAWGGTEAVFFCGNCSPDGCFQHYLWSAETSRHTQFLLFSSKICCFFLGGADPSWVGGSSYVIEQ